MIKKVLVATDGSKHAAKALTVASQIAAKFQAQLVILHVLLRDATSTTLRSMANKKELTKAQRHLLDHYEIDAQMDVARAGFEVTPVPIPPPAQLVQVIGNQLVERAAGVARRHRVKKVIPVTAEGDPAEAILKRAKKEKADLLVIGSRGFGEIKSLILGSVSHKVAAEANCPCLTVK